MYTSLQKKLVNKTIQMLRRKRECWPRPLLNGQWVQGGWVSMGHVHTRVWEMRGEWSLLSPLFPFESGYFTIQRRGRHSVIDLLHLELPHRSFFATVPPTIVSWDMKSDFRTLQEKVLRFVTGHWFYRYISDVHVREDTCQFANNAYINNVNWQWSFVGLEPWNTTNSCSQCPEIGNKTIN